MIKNFTKNTLHRFFIFTVTLMAISVMTLASPLHAAVKPCDTSAGASNSEVCKTSASDLTNGILKNVINVLLYVAGTIAVIMIIIGAIRYITSDGDSNRASQARNTIIYAVVGLVVAIMSFGIVNFVIGRL